MGDRCWDRSNGRHWPTLRSTGTADSWVSCRDCHDETQNHSTYYGCAKCHHSNLENIADETLSAKVVVHKSCWKCHLSGTGVKASERCSFCHHREEKAIEVAQEAE